jgi:ribulose 1,5-bisphosphate synthetase/thiazole synthase
MGTHDEDTRKFFANTRVHCELFAREGAHAQDSIVGRNTTDRIFTHHQKTVRSVLTWLVIVVGATPSSAQAAKLLAGGYRDHSILHDVVGDGLAVWCMSTCMAGATAILP